MRSRGFSIVSLSKLGAACFCFNRKGRKVDVGTKFNLSATDRCRFLPIFCGHFPSAVIFILNKIFLAGRLRDYFLTNMFLKCINFIWFNTFRVFQRSPKIRCKFCHYWNYESFPSAACWRLRLLDAGKIRYVSICWWICFPDVYGGLWSNLTRAWNEGPSEGS